MLGGRGNEYGPGRLFKPCQILQEFIERLLYAGQYAKSLFMISFNPVKLYLNFLSLVGPLSSR